MKWFVKMHTGYCGEDGYDVVDFGDASENEVQEEAHLMAIQHAESYGSELCSDDCEDEDCEFEHPGTSNIQGYAVPYDPEKHDMYSVNGKW